MNSPQKQPQSRILIDSNAYFRLAQSIHPLLSQEFGSQRYCLYIIDGFESEYFRSPRLNSSFAWVKQDEYVQNRAQKINRTNAQKKDAGFNFEYLKETAKDLDLTTSPVDTEALALAMTLSIPVVTDDSDMLTLAQEYGIATMKTLELLKLMKDEKHIDDARIDSITAYWDYSKDFPKNFLKDFKAIFGREPKRL